MKHPLELDDEKIHDAKQAIEKATSENIIDRCRKYLVVLDDYRYELYKFRGNPEINRRLKTFLPSEAVESLRKQVRTAVERTTRERNQVESLLKSFTLINGYEALETLNHFKYKGFSDWELKAGGVKVSGETEVNKISIQEAVEIASLLRRDEYLARKTNFGSKKYEQFS